MFFLRIAKGKIFFQKHSPKRHIFLRITKDTFFEKQGVQTADFSPYSERLIFSEKHLPKTTTFAP